MMSDLTQPVFHYKVLASRTVVLLSNQM